MLTNLKKRSALLLSVAVVCATVALVPQTASAAAWAPLATGLDVPGATTAYSACPNTSAPAAGFTDTTSTSVDCVKMFGITQGTTATTYSPADPVTRWQMALFLNRMYGPTGLAAGTGTFTAFTDTGSLSTEIQTAINGIAASGITVGTATGVYSPDQNVTRAEMAIFLMRMADLLKDNDANNDGTQVALSTIGTAANGGYNYTDIANQSHEGLLSIVRSYDMGIAEDACTAGTCDSTYRPNDDITRLEMAEMMHRLLNHTNARPAGVSIQTPTTAAAAATMVTQISVRGTDFSVSPNVSVNVMRHTDTVASALDDTAYNPLTGLCVDTIVVGTGTTECSMDAGDSVTNLLGNIGGPSATHAANQTITWTAHTGAQGSAYVDGTTAANKEVSTLGAATEYVSATTATLTTSARALATAYNLSADNDITDNSGEYTPFGESVTLTMTLTGAASAVSGAAAVVDGYSVRFAESRVCDTGNVTISSTDVISSGGVAQYTVAAAADTLPATLVPVAANTGNWCSSEVTITMAGTGTGAATNTYQPLGHQGQAVTLAGLTDGGYNTSWSDAAASWVTASDALAVSQNNALVSTTGTLIDATATAYDQYGRGMVGKTVKFTVDGADKIIATTGANGQAIYTFVACTANGVDAVATSTTGADMATIAATTPGAAAAEGTTVYCYSTAADGGFIDAAAVAEVQTAVMTDAAGGAALGGNVQYTYGGQTTAAIAFDANAAATGTAMDNLSTLEANAVEAAPTATSAEVQTVVFTFNTNWGDASAIGCVAGALTGSGTPTCVMTQGAQGVPLTVSDFIDHDSASNLIVAKEVITGHNGTAASNAATTYKGYTYDAATDMFNSAAVPGLTEAEFEVALNAVANLTTELMGTVRNGALTTGVSVFQIG